MFSELRLTLAAILAAVLLTMGYSVKSMKGERDAAVRNLAVAQSVARTLRDERNAANKKLEDAARTAADEASKQVRSELAVVIADARSRADAAERVRDQADTRAAGYRRRAEAGEASCRVLADSASKLDRSLAEGRRVAEELRGVIGERDSQVEFLSKLLLGSNGVGFVP